MNKNLYLTFKSWLSLALLAGLFGCNHVKEDKKTVYLPQNPEYLHRAMDQLTEAIVHDIFSPPVASRVYAYPSIAAYEALQSVHQGHQPLSGQLKGLTAVPKADTTLKIDYTLASVAAFLTVGKALVFSEDKITTFEDSLYQEAMAMGMDKAFYEASTTYGKQVASHILDWANQDNYKQTRTFPKYTLQDDEEAWKPTPPDYMEGIEPHWNKIRPFVIDSARQFTPTPPTAFDMKAGSPFYKELMEVYETGKNLTEEQTAIAQFWDCNPYVSHHKGHAMFAVKKITPGGHWIGITKIAARLKGSDVMGTAEAYARVSIALADAFISCWDEKWRSILVRPETLIHQYLDESWAPLLQTPPFPEYTSGHSVISAAASEVLTNLYGENTAFIDSTEVAYGLPPRSFPSFIAAADEAAISRLYGGIHYMPAIENGVSQGKKVGQYIIKRLTTQSETVH